MEGTPTTSKSRSLEIDRFACDDIHGGFPILDEKIGQSFDKRVSRVDYFRHVRIFGRLAVATNTSSQVTMHIRRGVTLAACERLGARCHRISDKRSALFVQSSLMLKRLQHKSV